MQDKQYYTIGEVAKLCNVNIRTLHYYDDIGLLTPEKTDISSHYRYYTYAQVLEVMFIKEFKFIGFSLKEVKHLMKRDDLDFNQKMLTMKCSEIDKTIASLTSLKQRLQQHVSAIENRFLCEEQAICRKSVEEMMVAYVNISCECTPEVFNKHYVELVSKIEHYGLEIVGNRFAFFHGEIDNMKYNDTNVTLYLPIAKTTMTSAFIDTIAKHEVLAKMHHGPYHKLANIHKDLSQYAREQKITTRPGFLHNFIINMATTKHEDDFITEVMLEII